MAKSFLSSDQSDGHDHFPSQVSPNFVKLRTENATFVQPAVELKVFSFISGLEGRLMEFFPSVNQQQTEENISKTFKSRDLAEVVTFRKQQAAAGTRSGWL